MREALLLLGASLLLATPSAQAVDRVTPAEGVRSRVMVRGGPDRGAVRVGSLHVGEEAEYLGSTPGWRRIRLSDGTTGFVSERWTRVLAAPGPDRAVAQRVLPAERVRSRINVREAASRKSAVVAQLAVGEQADLIGSEPGWRQIRLRDGATGYVSEEWSRIVAVPDPRSEQTAGGGKSSFRRFLERTFGAFGGPKLPEVSLVVRDPEPGLAAYRNTSPELPVAGFATVEGGGLNWDVVLALDLSTSTNEFAEADVNGDGLAEDAFKGRDSIFAAQIAAARAFVDSVEGLPRNRNGERIRVGIVTYGGEERFHLRHEDEDLEISDATIRALAARDAQTRLALTSDYRAARRQLWRLAKVEPVGMTDVAAGVGRALVELEGWEGAYSRPRPGARKVVLLLTDGKPSLPYDRKLAEAATAWAGRMATDSGVRINAYALGRNAVTRSRSDAVHRMARRTGGVYVPLEKPAEVVDVVRTTSFSLVEGVEIANRTTGRSTRRIATGIDGSFYGEIVLAPGSNRIELTARLDDGRSVDHAFDIEYVEGRPRRQLESQLKRIRLENEALIEKIRTDMARDMAKMRRQREQRKALDVTVDAPAAPAD